MDVLWLPLDCFCEIPESGNKQVSISYAFVWALFLLFACFIQLEGINFYLIFLSHY